MWHWQELQSGDNSLEICHFEQPLIPLRFYILVKIWIAVALNGKRACGNKCKPPNRFKTFQNVVGCCSIFLLWPSGMHSFIFWSHKLKRSHFNDCPNGTTPIWNERKEDWHGREGQDGVDGAPEFYVYISCPFSLISAFSFQLLLKVRFFQSSLFLYRLCPFYSPGRSRWSTSADYKARPHRRYPCLHDFTASAK